MMWFYYTFFVPSKPFHEVKHIKVYWKSFQYTCAVFNSKTVYMNSSLRCSIVIADYVQHTCYFLSIAIYNCMFLYWNVTWQQKCVRSIKRQCESVLLWCTHWSLSSIISSSLAIILALVFLLCFFSLSLSSHYCVKKSCRKQEFWIYTLQCLYMSNWT